MVPFLDLKSQYESIEGELKDAVLTALASTQYALGAEVAAFEEEFADYVDAKFAVGVNSGTSALHLALLAVGVGPGDEVITVSSTFVATVAAIEYTGATPVFVDVSNDTLTMDPLLVEAEITPRTKALLPVHLHGHPCDISALKIIADKHGIVVVEDAAQAHGAEVDGHRVGALGAVGCFSFYPGKNLGACGEGGILTTNDPDIAETARMLRDWGQAAKYDHVLKGFNYRLDGIQGAALRVKLRYLDSWTERRREAASTYATLLEGLPLRLPVERPECRHVYHVFAIRTDRRDELQAALTAAQVSTGIHYPIPVHLQKAYSNIAYRPESLEVTEKAAKELLSLPLYAELTPDQIKRVAAAVSDSLTRLAA